MARRTRSHTQQYDLPPPSTDPVQEQGSQQDLNNLHAEEILEHRPGKEPMAVEADDGANLGKLTRRTERLEDVIGAVQTMINQLNQFLVRATGQGILLLPTLVGPAQQAPSPHSGGNKGPRSNLTSLKLTLQDVDRIYVGGHAPH